MVSASGNTASILYYVNSEACFAIFVFRNAATRCLHAAQEGGFWPPSSRLNPAQPGGCCRRETGLGCGLLSCWAAGLPVRGGTASSAAPVCAAESTRTDQVRSIQIRSDQETHCAPLCLGLSFGRSDY